MADELEIFLSDITIQTQKKVLKFLGIKAAKEANLNVFALLTFPGSNAMNID